MNCSGNFTLVNSQTLIATHRNKEYDRSGEDAIDNRPPASDDHIRFEPLFRKFKKGTRRFDASFPAAIVLMVTISPSEDCAMHSKEPGAASNVKLVMCRVSQASVLTANRFEWQGALPDCTKRQKSQSSQPTESPSHVHLFPCVSVGKNGTKIGVRLIEWR